MDESHFCTKWSLVLLSGILFISVVWGQYVNMPSHVYTQRKSDKFPNEPSYFGSLYLPVDGRNATLDCNNYDRNPTECARIPHCDYHCHTARCRDSDIPDEQGCSQFCLNVCACKQAGCFDQAGVNCRPASGCPFKVARANPKGPPITLRKSSKFPFNLCPDGVTVQRISPKRGDFEYVPVISVNLGGERHVDEEGWIFEADANVEFEDPDGIREQAEMAPEEVAGVSEHDRPLYATYVKGGGGGGGGGGDGGGGGGDGGGGDGGGGTGKKRKRSEGGEGGETVEGGGGAKCLSYVASLCEEGNYLLDLKVIEPEHEKSGDRLFDVRINDVVVLDELNILAWTRMKGRAAEILIRFYYGAGDELVVGGQRANVTDGEIKISFCQSDCPNVTDPGFVASAFQVLHWQRSVNVNGRVVSHRGDECRCRILAGKEYSYGTSLCTSPRECSPCAVKSSCMRANAVYVNGGVACKNRFARGSCIVEEVISAVNMNGRAHHDSRGIRYVADDELLYEDPFRLRYDYDGDILSYGSCPVDVWTRHVVTGVVAADAILYETFTRSYSSGSQGMCMSYNISEKVKTDGKYEMVIKTVEPMYEQPGQRSFSVRLFHDESEDDKPVLADFDILKFSEPCEATDVVVNFEITDGGSKVVIPGHDPRELTENRMKLGFCLSTCSGNISKSKTSYDPDFIASAFYIARIADKPEPHIEEHNKTTEGGGGGGEGGGGGGGGGEGGGEGGGNGPTTTKRPGGGNGGGGNGNGSGGSGGGGSQGQKPGGPTSKKPGSGFGQTSTVEPGGGSGGGFGS